MPTTAPRSQPSPRSSANPIFHRPTPPLRHLSEERQTTRVTDRILRILQILLILPLMPILIPMPTPLSAMGHKTMSHPCPQINAAKLRTSPHLNTPPPAASPSCRPPFPPAVHRNNIRSSPSRVASPAACAALNQTKFRTFRPP